jgi:hypothetical protein
LELAWRESDVPRVERRAPLPAANGKILHLHRSSRQTERTLSVE